jgi:DNA polymerase III epsilon subunit-like protein
MDKTMTPDFEWTLLDTETTGIVRPIWAVEIGAQRMQGWAPVGPSFRVLLNHDVDIPVEASRIHGYTRQMLMREGIPPGQAHQKFRDYSGSRPLVSYNLKYDYDDVLLPEWNRLAMAPIGRQGFCVLRLAQRLLYPSPTANFRLETLRGFYNLPARRAHSAVGDVETVVDLLGSVLRPLASERGLNSFDELASYAMSEWYPETLTFGKFKGRHFQDARHDRDLRGWLEWLARQPASANTRLAKWYLDQLDRPGGN